MFEDSTFESNGKIRTRSRFWMIASLAFNTSILATLLLIPILYPQALPHALMPYLMTAAAPVAQPRPHFVHLAAAAPPQFEPGQFYAPRKIPGTILMVNHPEALPEIDVAAWGDSAAGPGGANNPFDGQHTHPVVRPAPQSPVRVPSTVVAGMILYRSVPSYPPIARATGVQGTVVLEATISASGTIENLHVVSGPIMLQQSVIEAVQAWRYRPFLFHDQPVPVETTINVVFTLNK